MEVASESRESVMSVHPEKINILKFCVFTDAETAHRYFFKTKLIHKRLRNHNENILQMLENRHSKKLLWFYYFEWNIIKTKWIFFGIIFYPGLFKRCKFRCSKFNRGKFHYINFPLVNFSSEN